MRSKRPSFWGGLISAQSGQRSKAKPKKPGFQQNHYTPNVTTRPCPAASVVPRSQYALLCRDGIDQRIEQVGSRSGLTFPRVDIDGDDSFFRVATESDAEMMLLILDPEIRVAGEPSRLYLGVRETESSHDVRDPPLALLSRCH